MHTRMFLATAAIFTASVTSDACYESPSSNEVSDGDLKDLGQGSNAQSQSHQKTVKVHRQVNKQNRTRALKLDGTGEFDFFENPYATLEFGYSDFENTRSDNAGHTHYQGLTLGGSLGSETDISLTLSHDELEQRGMTDFRARTFGATVTINHHINDWLSAGVFGFYAETEIDGFKENTDTYGGGFFLGGYWAFAEGFDFSTTHSLSTAYDDYTHDNLYLASGRLGYDWSDDLNTGVNLTYTNSLRNLRAIDTAYWTFGLDANWHYNEHLSFGLSWETLQSQDHNHQSDTFFTINWIF